MDAVIYARISQDRDGEGLGVERQEEDCRRLAEQQGWTVTEVYVDNDVSASNAKPRPQYRRMIADIEAGRVKAIVAHRSDRLYRRLTDLAELITLAESRHIEIATVASGEINLNTADGLTTAGVLASVAAGESRRSSERIARKHTEIAAAGRPHGGGVRPFGYVYDRETKNYLIEPTEAQAIRRMVDGVLSGRSLLSIVHELNDEGSTTKDGKPWNQVRMAVALRRPFLTGMREHHGVLTQGTWEALMTREEQDLVDRILRSNNKGGRRAVTGRTSLLAGLLWCEECGGKVYYSRHKNASYICSISGGGKGCLRIDAAFLDAHVWTLAADHSPVPRKHVPSPEAKALVTKRLQLIERKDALAEKYAVGLLDDRDYRVARDKVTSLIASIDRRLAETPLMEQRGFRRLGGMHLSEDERRDYVRSVVSRVTVRRAARRGQPVHERVEVNLA